MIRAVVIIMSLFAAVGSARSADLPLTATDRSKSPLDRNPQRYLATGGKVLPLRSPVARGKSKPIKAQAHSPSPSKHVPSPELALTVRTSDSTSAVAGGDEWKTYVSKYMSEVVTLAVNAPEVIAAVQEQNAANAGLRADQIEALDRQWRAERKANGGLLNNVKMYNATSEFLKGFRTASNGPIVEMLVMDNKGLNVAQTDPTSDYMQGDEDKWQKTFGAGPWMAFVDKPDEVDGKETVQVSVTLVDNDVAIGAMTVTLDLDKVPMK